MYLAFCGDTGRVHKSTHILAKIVMQACLPASQVYIRGLYRAHTAVHYYGIVMLSPCQQSCMQGQHTVHFKKLKIEIPTHGPCPT